MTDRKTYKYEMKPLFEERLRKLMPNEEDFLAFERIVHTGAQDFIRCNTIKISPEDLMKRLSKKWDVEQPFPNHKEIILIKSNLLPGELGKSIEHLMGYYYIQEISSMLPPIALAPEEGDFILDLFASPGSKTTQIASYMNNKGTILANDLKMDRIAILAANLERCGVTNTLISRQDAISLCSKLSKERIKFDKILVDAPCSGEGTLRSSPKTFLMWNPKVIKKLSRQQKKFVAFAFKCLKVGGSLVYSTCTHAPEENEEIVSFILNNFPVKIESLHLPISCRPGITEWEDEKYNEQTKMACRVEGSANVRGVL